MYYIMAPYYEEALISDLRILNKFYPLSWFKKTSFYLYMKNIAKQSNMFNS